MPKRTVSLLLATGTILMVASWAALEWARPRTDIHDVPTWLGLIGGMANAELASLAVSFGLPVLLVGGLRFHRLSLLPLLPAVVAAAILISELVHHHATRGPLPLPLLIVNLAGAATVIGIAAISAGICSLLVIRPRSRSRAAIHEGGPHERSRPRVEPRG